MSWRTNRGTGNRFMAGSSSKRGKNWVSGAELSEAE